MITVDRASTSKKLKKKQQTKKTGAEVTQIHAVAIIGLNYKSPLYWYDVYTNNNGKLDAPTYIEVYTRAFKDIEAHHGSKDFKVWEDGDGTHTCKEVVD